ncbi:MAG: lipid-A-disaccharide synthase [Fimbriimonas sp.]
MAAEISPKPLTVFFSAGEASGDAYAVALLQELQKLAPIHAVGVGGVRSREAGIETFADSSRWGAIGIVEAIRVYPRVLVGYRRALRQMAAMPPGLLVAIDFGFMNIRLCRHAKRLGWKVLYFVPPGSWKRGPQGKDLASLTDLVVTPTSWSFDQLAKIGVNVRWFGHPLKQLLGRATRAQRDPSRIALVLGSRDPEVALLREVVRDIVAAPAFKDYTFEFPLAPNVNLEALRAWWIAQTGRTQDIFHREGTATSFRRCHAAIVCSGTATLEAALCGCPMVVVYKVRKLAELEGRILRIRPKFIALPNLILDEPVVPELIQHAATPKAIGDLLLPLLSGERREAQLEAFARIDTALGGANAITETAVEAIKLARNGL